MKTTQLFILCAAVAVSISAVEAESPKPPETPPARFPQIELEARFLTISASAAERLGLTHGPGDSGSKWPGVLTAPSYEKLLRLLKTEKTVNLLSAPRVTTKSGQRAVVEVIREFRYPTAFGESGDHLTPAAFVTVNTGVSFEVEPVVGPSDLIELTAITKLTEFNRFVSYEGGRTQKPEPIPKGGFSQPLFDTMQNAVSVILRPGQTLLLDGSEWSGASGLSMKRMMDAGAVKLEADPKAEAELLFVTVTAKLIKADPRRAEHGGELKAGGPVEIASELMNIPRDRLPKDAFGNTDGTEGNIVPPDLGELASVLDGSQTDALRKTLREASGGQVSVAPVKTIASDRRYLAEVTGVLHYPVQPGKMTAHGSKGAAEKSETERMVFRLGVRPHANGNGTIDLDITPALTTSAEVGDAASGMAAAQWKLSEDDARGASQGLGKSVTTSLTIWNGTSATIVFLRSAERRKDQVQVLMITVRVPDADGKKTPVGDGKVQKWPDALGDGVWHKWPEALKVPGKPGFVKSPYKTDAGLIDVRGFAKGTEVKDPYTGEIFLAP
jgi:hypothetical protein